MGRCNIVSVIHYFLIAAVCFFLGYVYRGTIETERGTDASNVAIKRERNNTIDRPAAKRAKPTPGKLSTERAKPAGRPLRDSSAVLVLQAADEKYAAARNRTSYLDVNKEWAQCNNYAYEFQNLNNETGNVYTQKVEAILDAVMAAEENDWVVYLDADVYHRADSCEALKRMIPHKSNRDGEPCELIAMSTPMTINTGVILLKATSETRSLLKRWLELQRVPDKLLSFGAADQLSLQEAVLERFRGKDYYGECNEPDVQAQRNLCFFRNMPVHRSVQRMCLLPCYDKNPLECQGCKAECHRNASVFHHDSRRERYKEAHGYDAG